LFRQPCTDIYVEPAFPKLFLLYPGRPLVDASGNVRAAPRILPPAALGCIHPQKFIPHFCKILRVRAEILIVVYGDCQGL